MNAERRSCTDLRMQYVLPCITEPSVCVIGGKTRDYKLFSQGSFDASNLRLVLSQSVQFWLFYEISSLYGRTLHAELAFGVWLLNLLSFSWIQMHVVVLMTRFVISNTELNFQDALLRALTTSSNMKKYLINRMSWEFRVQFSCDVMLSHTVSGPKLLAGK